MVWIHGGGYTLGSKTLYSPSAAGLIKASQSNGKEGVIWLAMNYRLGIFVCTSTLSKMSMWPDFHIFELKLLTLLISGFSQVLPFKRMELPMLVFTIRDSLLSGFNKISTNLAVIRIGSRLSANPLEEVAPCTKSRPTVG
jgi:hypothetical protein